MLNFFFTIILLLFLPTKVRASNISDLIDKTTVYLIETWTSDKNLKDWYAPQVITVQSGTKLYGGGCKGANSGIDVAGVVTSRSFSGPLAASFLTGALPAIDGSALTGMASTDNVRTGILDVAGIATFRADAVFLKDDTQLRFGDGSDFRIYHNSSNSFHYVVSQNNAPILVRSSGEDMAKFLPDGAVELMHNGSKRFETTSAGAKVTGDLDITGVLTYEDVTNVDSVGIITARSGVLVGSGITLSPDGDIFAVGVSTFSNDVTFTGANHNIVFDKSDDRLEFADGAELSLGDSEDFKIHYENLRTFARQHGSGPFVFDLFNQFNSLEITGGQLTSTIAKFIPNGPVELYHNNNKRLETTGYGISITGTTDTDNFINTGISTFVGIITASATENVIPFLYSNFSDLPSATSYHGAFAHVHARGKGYFAHAANWYELVNKELDGTIGVGTEQVRVGVTTVTTFNATGNVTLGDADTDNIVLNGEINSNVIPNTNIAYDLGSTTKRWGTLFTGASTKIDSDIITRNLSVTGLGTFANDVTFTGASYNAVWDQSDNALEFADNAKATFGDSADLTLRHTGSASYLENSTGFLFIHGNDIALRSTAQENYIVCDADARVDVYYDNTKRLSTSGAGVTVYNQLDTTNINASGIITAVDGNFTGNVSIAGTLTYQDVTNVDSIGIATARVGLDVLSGGINAVGIVTADGLDAIGIQSGGVNITTGIITAINFTGTGNTVTYDSSTKIVSVSV